MGNQYQNFTNPTIVPDQKYGWDLANQNTQQAISSIGGYLADQQSKVQGLQLQQASDLSKAHVMASLYYPQAVPTVESMMAQNPYARRAFPQQQGRQMSQAGQGGMSGTNPNMFGSMIGAPGTNAYGGGMLPIPTMQGGADNSGNGSTGSLNPVNGPVSTGGSVTSGGMEPPKFSQSFVNPAGEAASQAAKTGAETMTTAQTEASLGQARDTEQLGMLENAFKPLMDSYNKVYNSKVAGVIPAAGDVYGSNVVKNADWIPRFAQSSVVNPDTQTAAGQFLANKNEIAVKLQPILSQQFGKEGSMRIMESLLNMSQNEIGDLNTPKAQIQGQVAGTLSSAYRFAKAAQAYKQDLDTSGQKPPDPDTAASEIFKRAQMQQLSPAEQKQLQDTINRVIGIQSTGGASGSFQGSANPVAQAKSQPKPQQQSSVATQFTRQQILDEINRRKNLRDVMSNISQ